MKTFRLFVWTALKSAAAAASAAFVLAGCATVDLGPDAGAPQVRMPGDTPVVAPKPPTPETVLQDTPVRTMPVAPGGVVAPPPELANPVDPTAPTGDAPAATPTGTAPAIAPAGGAPATNAHLVTLTTRPDGASAVPSTTSSATAQIDLLYDASTRLLRWIANWTGLSGTITGVRFYGPAAPGQQGPPTLIWPGPFGPRYEGRATLTPQQATDLMGGLWYVNISTTNYPDGEIRGQVRVVY